MKAQRGSNGGCQNESQEAEGVLPRLGDQGEVLRVESQLGQGSQRTGRKERPRGDCCMVLPGHLQAIREGEFLPSEGMSQCQRQWLSSPGEWETQPGWPHLVHGTWEAKWVRASRLRSNRAIGIGSQNCCSGCSLSPGWYADMVRSAQGFHQVGGGVGFALTSTKRVWVCG